jgi:uncharacterized membrane protein YwzB
MGFADMHGSGMDCIVVLVDRSSILICVYAYFWQLATTSHKPFVKPRSVVEPQAQLLIASS